MAILPESGHGSQILIKLSLLSSGYQITVPDEI